MAEGIRLNSEHVRTFRLAAEFGSFTRAAQELFLSQPAVSMHIRRLEEELNVRLFERSGGHLRLTEEGEIVLKFASELDGLLSDLRQELGGRVPSTRPLVLGCGTITTDEILPPMLAEFWRAHPETLINIRVLALPEIRDRLKRGEVDIGILPHAFLAEGLSTQLLSREEAILVAASSHPLARIAFPTVEEISSYQFIAADSQPGGSLNELWARLQGVNVHTILRLGSGYAAREAVKQGMGIAILPERIVRDDVQTGRLVSIPTHGLPLVMPLYVAYRPRAAELHGVRELLAVLARHAGALA